MAANQIRLLIDALQLGVQPLDRLFQLLDLLGQMLTGCIPVSADAERIPTQGLGFRGFGSLGWSLGASGGLGGWGNGLR
jgi:hypothetical protein